MTELTKCPRCGSENPKRLVYHPETLTGCTPWNHDEFHSVREAPKPPTKCPTCGSENPNMRLRPPDGTDNPTLCNDPFHSAREAPPNDWRVEGRKPTQKEIKRGEALQSLAEEVLNRVREAPTYEPGPDVTGKPVHEWGVPNSEAPAAPSPTGSTNFVEELTPVPSCPVCGKPMTLDYKCSSCGSESGTTGIVFNEKGLEICRQIVDREKERNPEGWRAACEALGWSFEQTGSGAAPSPDECARRRKMGDRFPIDKTDAYDERVDQQKVPAAPSPEPPSETATSLSAAKEGNVKQDVIAGFLEVGRNEKHEVVVNHPDLKPDENGVGHIVFSQRQARAFARLLLNHAAWAEAEEKGEPSPNYGITGGGD